MDLLQGRKHSSQQQNTTVANNWEAAAFLALSVTTIYDITAHHTLHP
jgi:hypothetical protein